MKTLTKTAIGLSAAGAAYFLINKRNRAEPLEKRVPPHIYGFVTSGYETVREAFAENFSKRGEIGAACCVYHKGEIVVDLWGGVRDTN